MAVLRRYSDDALMLLDLLTWRVRVAGTEQLHDLFLACYGRRLPPALLGMLVSNGWLQQEVLVLTVPDAESPLFAWSPREGRPAVGALQWQLRRRTETAVPRRVAVVSATPRAVHLTGGSAGLGRQPYQVQHDLRTTAALLGHLRHDPNIHRRWLGEDLLPLRLPGLFPRKRPDAVVLTEEDSLARIIEAGGAYSARQLRNLHECYARLGVPYEVW